MRLPPWLSLICAALIFVWGLYRIRLGLRDPEAERRALTKKGLYGLPRRTHLLIGVVYLLLGAGLVAVTLGWNPLAGAFGPGAEPTAPTTPSGDGFQVAP